VGTTVGVGVAVDDTRGSGVWERATMRGCEVLSAIGGVPVSGGVFRGVGVVVGRGPSIEDCAAATDCQTLSSGRRGPAALADSLLPAHESREMPQMVRRSVA